MAFQGSCGVFRGAAEVRVVIVECFFFSVLGVFGRLGASEEFLVILRERHVNFLVPITSFGSSGLVLLVGMRHDWVKGRATRGRDFECGWSVIFSWLGTRKGA